MALCKRLFLHLGCAKKWGEIKNVGGVGWGNFAFASLFKCEKSLLCSLISLGSYRNVCYIYVDFFPYYLSITQFKKGGIICNHKVLAMEQLPIKIIPWTHQLPRDRNCTSIICKNGSLNSTHKDGSQLDGTSIYPFKFDFSQIRCIALCCQMWRESLGKESIQFTSC